MTDNVNFNLTSGQNYDMFMNIWKSQWEKKIGVVKAKSIMEFLHKKYDKLGRVYLDKKIFPALIKNHQKIKSDEMPLYIITGRGGKGKTTLGMNIAYFHDNDFKVDKVTFGFGEMGKVLIKYVENPSPNPRAILIDEPNDDPHHSAFKGKKLAEVIGQVRKTNTILIFCATDLKDIPTKIFNKATHLIFLRNRTTARLFMDSEKGKESPLDELKKRYATDGYSAFSKIIQKKGNSILRFSHTKGNAIFDLYPEAKGLYEKAKDTSILESLNDFVYGKIGAPGEQEQKNKKQIIIELYNKNFSYKEIAVKLNTSYNYVQQTLGQYKAEVKMTKDIPNLRINP